jgi:hypothetical protein
MSEHGIGTMWTARLGTTDQVSQIAQRQTVQVHKCKPRHQNNMSDLCQILQTDQSLVVLDVPIS